MSISPSRPQWKPNFGARINWNHPLAWGLVNCWLMNEGSRTIVHDIGKKPLNLTLGAAASWGAAQGLGAVSFNGTGNSFIQSTLFTPAGSMTFSLWHYFTSSITVLDYLMGTQAGGNAGGRFLRYSTGTNLLQFEVIGDTATIFGAQSSTGILINGWNHVAGVIDTAGAVQSLYINGILQNTVALTGTFNTVISTFAFAKRPDSNANFYTGLIRNALIYNRALSADQVSRLYAQPYCFLQPRYPVLYGKSAILANTNNALWFGSNF